MDSAGIPRFSHEESYRILQRLGHLAEGALPTRRPGYRPRVGDDESLNIQFFRTLLDDCSCENLTLSQTFFGRSAIDTVSFKNTDLSESSLCWNDFSNINFSEADLSDCDLRASLFRETTFVRASLRNADLRHSTFTGCDFTDAIMQGAKLTRHQGEQLKLSDQQKAAIDWQESDGEQPPGG